MFKEQYIRDNERLHAREGLLMDIQKKAAADKRRADRMPRYALWGAAVAAAILLAIGIPWLVRKGGPSAGTPQAVSAAAGAAGTQGPAPDAAAHDATGYDELYALIEQSYGGMDATDGGVMATAAAVDAAVEAPAAAEGSAPKANAEPAAMDAYSGSGGDYSGTNVQVSGVDEADVVKTDGNYIYYVANSTLHIVKPDGAATTVVGSVPLENDDSWWGYSTEMYLAGGRLLLIQQGSATVWVKTRASGAADARTDDSTRILLYDVSDPALPKKLATLGQSGHYVSSRLTDGYVYIVTSQYVWQPVKGEPVTFVPSLSVDGRTEALPAADISVCGNPSGASYTVVGAIDIQNGLSHAAAKAVYGSSDTVYCSGDYLLLGASEYERDTSPIAPDETGKNVQVTVSSPRTRLLLFSLDGAKITRLESAYIDGTLLNQFALDLYGDAFRIVTTIDRYTERIYTDGVDTYEYDDERYNRLVTLDLSLHELARIDRLGEDEMVRSVRFDGAVGYFVTFRQTDPLFAVDLSDPKAPRVLDALKIPGFSAYLHVYADGRLLGIGYAADEQTGRTEGVKLTMFDVTDKTNVRERVTAAVDASWTNAGDNHKCVFVDGARGLIGFPADDAYYLYGYSEADGFTLLRKVTALADVYSWNLRAVRIGDCLYVLGDSFITVLSLENYEKLVSLPLPVG